MNTLTHTITTGGRRSKARSPRLRMSTLALALVVLAAGCGSSDATADRSAPSGTTRQSVEVDGATRDYRLYRPAGITARAPLVLVYHGWQQNVQWSQRLGWQQLADRRGFLVAFPVGINESFNAGECCGPAQEQGVDDVAAAHAIIDDVARKVRIDRNRVYAAGFSNGGMMAYRLACESNRFAAVGPVAGVQAVDCPRPRPISILHIHGTADTWVPFGGTQRTDENPAAVRPVLAQWRNRMGCAPVAVTSAGTVRRTSSRCPRGRDIDLVTIRGLDHEWPTRAAGINATEALWRFFARHRRQATGGVAR